MRRYSRYKICKTNFHFFFLSARILNFNRPKWNLLKEKVEIIKKVNKQKLQNNCSLKNSKYILRSFFNIAFLFKSSKIIEKKNISYSRNRHNDSTCSADKNFNLCASFEYSFID